MEDERPIPVEVTERMIESVDDLCNREHIHTIAIAFDGTGDQAKVSVSTHGFPHDILTCKVLVDVLNRMVQGLDTIVIDAGSVN